MPPRPSTPVRLTGPLPLRVRLEPDPKPQLDPRAPLAALLALTLLMLLLVAWVLLILAPTALPKTVSLTTGDLDIFLSFPALTFVGDETTIDLSVVNRGTTPVTGTVVLKLPETPVIHLTSEGDNTVALAALAPDARATAHLKFVAEGDGALTFTPQVRLETQPPADLAAQTLTISRLPRLNSLRSWIFGVFVAGFAFIAQPWLKRLSKPWLPSD